MRGEKCGDCAALVDVRDNGGDCAAFCALQDIDRSMGPTLYLPGSHTADAHAAEPEITSYGSARSSWSNVFMLLPAATAVERGDRLLVRTHADLAGAVPTYRFDVALGRDEELHLGSFAYPEAPPPPGGSGEDECLVAVSYTHLTLPTKA